MAMTLKQFEENWPEILEKLKQGGTHCANPKCKKNLEEENHPDDFRKDKRGFVCDDCYFEDFGEEIEKHPIFTPRIIGPRGC